LPYSHDIQRPSQCSGTDAEALKEILMAGDSLQKQPARIAAVVDTFVRAIETRDFGRCLQLVEAEPGSCGGMYDTGPRLFR
jgi:hypothetical protein